MHDRRGMLKAAVLAALALALPPGPPWREFWRGLRVERRGKVFLVDGWVLTADDVRPA
jgi:hypothetical protein